MTHDGASQPAEWLKTSVRQSTCRGEEQDLGRLVLQYRSASQISNPDGLFLGIIKRLKTCKSIQNPRYKASFRSIADYNIILQCPFFKFFLQFGADLSNSCCCHLGGSRQMMQVCDLLLAYTANNIPFCLSHVPLSTSFKTLLKLIKI